MSTIVSQRTNCPCVTLVGMAGAGKSTVGAALAERLGWAHVDTDLLIEAFFGQELQAVFDALGRERFLEAEEEVVAGLNLKRAVVSTGGSVIYGPRAVARLKELGPVIHLEPGLEEARKRVGDARGRGLAIADGQSFDDLYRERRPLYEAAADLTLPSSGSSAPACAEAAAKWLGEQGLIPGEDE
ncbi:homoserine kinase [Desulfocurvus sp. DL9XJH121]